MDSPNLEGLDRFAFDPRRVEKPWGHELIWACSELYSGKELFIRRGHALSLQFHREKDETIFVQSGRVEVSIAGPGEAVPAVEVVGPGHAFRITPGTVHRMKALEDSLVLEVSTNHPDDVVRLEDDYGR